MKLQCSLVWLVLLGSSGLDVYAFRLGNKKRRALTSDDSVREEQHGGKLLALLSDDAHHQQGLRSFTTRHNTTGLEHPNPDNRLMDAITRMQVETCVHMKKLYSEEFDAFKTCLELLSKLCRPGDDLRMDGDHHEKPTGEGFCQGFFGAKKKIREKAKKRAQECVKISKKQDKSSDEYKSCLKYMTKLCDPGEDLLMDGDEKENPTGTGVCQGFFRDKNIKANETDGNDMEGNETEGGGEGGDGKGGSGGELGKKGNAGEANSDGEEDGTGGNGEGNSGGAKLDGEGAEGGGGGSDGARGSTVGAPAPAPVASPEVGGEVSSLEAGGIANGTGDSGEAEGAVEGNGENSTEGTDRKAGPPLPPYHMKEDTGLQEQGFEGPNVEHDDMKTRTSDWRKEYGPNHPNYQKIVAICLKHPVNPWCRRHLPKIRGTQKKPTGRLAKSIAEQVASSMFVTFLVVSVQISWWMQE